MKITQEIKLAVDAVVFGYQNNQLYILLIKQKYGAMKDQWALPGGFVHNDEPLIKAVYRELQEETGVTSCVLEQLFTFGDRVERDPRFRVVSVAYFGTVNPSHMVLEASTDAKDVMWCKMDEIPELSYDHNDIALVALGRLKAKLNYEPIGFDLLEDSFPFSNVENLYMTILGKKIDRRNFRKKILSFGFIEEAEGIVSKGSGRPAQLYKFNQAKYQMLKEEGINFEIKFA